MIGIIMFGVALLMLLTGFPVAFVFGGLLRSIISLAYLFLGDSKRGHQR